MKRTLASLASTLLLLGCTTMYDRAQLQSHISDLRLVGRPIDEAIMILSKDSYKCDGVGPGLEGRLYAHCEKSIQKFMGERTYRIQLIGSGDDRRVTNVSSDVMDTMC